MLFTKVYSTRPSACRANQSKGGYSPVQTTPPVLHARSIALHPTTCQGPTYPHLILSLSLCQRLIAARSRCSHSSRFVWATSIRLLMLMCTCGCRHPLLQMIENTARHRHAQEGQSVHTQTQDRELEHHAQRCHPRLCALLCSIDTGRSCFVGLFASVRG